ncbi:MAG: hypothetical protein Q8O66_00090, partial [bacterium]|nr:hypothetical protein [bacterium]
MLNQVDIENIKKTTEDFFQRMTVSASCIEAVLSCANKELSKEDDENKITNDVIELNIKLEEPQILIGEKGQTLSEIQRLLKIILNKKLQKVFYLNLDINDYKKKKIEYLKDLANDLANEVVLTKEERTLFPMPAYERRIIHTELTSRSDILTESQGY